ncbi:hypothetical protein ERJ75_000447100 [Trypanosoma vivax]|nr:hypothetical protein ERJ75_000447100 [Trypanosoma vivax]
MMFFLHSTVALKDLRTCARSAGSAATAARTTGCAFRRREKRMCPDGEPASLRGELRVRRDRPDEQKGRVRTLWRHRVPHLRCGGAVCPPALNRRMNARPHASPSEATQQHGVHGQLIARPMTTESGRTPAWEREPKRKAGNLPSMGCRGKGRAIGPHACSNVFAATGEWAHSGCIAAISVRLAHVAWPRRHKNAKARRKRRESGSGPVQQRIEKSMAKRRGGTGRRAPRHAVWQLPIFVTRLGKRVEVGSSGHGML